MSDIKKDQISRRSLLIGMGLAPLILRSAPLYGAYLNFGFEKVFIPSDPAFPFADMRITPRYPARSPLADVLRLVPAGSDEYKTEKYAIEIEELLRKWGVALKSSIAGLDSLGPFLASSVQGCFLSVERQEVLRSGFGIEVRKRIFKPGAVSGRESFLQEIRDWLKPLTRVETAEFEIFELEATGSVPLSVRVALRYDVVGKWNSKSEERIGTWRLDCVQELSGEWKAQSWTVGEEVLSAANGPVFIDVTQQALGATESYGKQMLRGVDDWRTVLDGATGIDVYSNNGVAAGDYNNDGFDDFYVSQPAGLPNRLYRNRGDGTFEDVTEKAGVGVLDNTACALFVDFENRGLQDLLVVCGGGPLLFRNQGDGTFQLKPDAFKFAQPPQGTFTHAAVADYDGDGRLDIYFCMYMYYLGLDQYHYPVPYFDAHNGPPNCLLHNQGDGTFVETTKAAGMNADNDRYSFACAWGDSNGNGLPDLCVANDFGSSQLYRNNGDGTFKVVSGEAHIEDVGAGMSACWSDYDNDSRQDIYITSMWEAAGQRVSEQPQFHQEASEKTRSLYQRHARGNALYRNEGNGKFLNVSQQSGVAMGRWSWSSDFWDFDHDGFPDLYVTNGYISAVDRNDLASFFWRQVVAKSPDDASPSLAYEHGWNAINELIRSDKSWNAYERNVLFANNRDGTFSDVSGIAGMDFLEDSRSFALADIDHDGRLEVILKSRNVPQLRILHNGMKDIGDSIVFRLRGTRSNRDAIGASVTVEAGSLRQTRYLQAGSGFLAQHGKELFFGLGKSHEPVRATVRWPNGHTKQFDQLPVNHRIEIEEGQVAVTSKPFSLPPASFSQAGTPVMTQPPLSKVETWLVEPLKAPTFSLPDVQGQIHDLQTSQGSFVLLNFWATRVPDWKDQLRSLHDHRSEFAANSLQVLAVNVDEVKVRETVTIAVRIQTFSFPILFASDEVQGIYNIIYRHLFDRRRDLGIPTSFLLDRAGMIVKVYQGAVSPGQVTRDVISIPTTRPERLRNALPFAGILCQSTMQRNDFTYGVAFFQHGYLEQAAESFQQVIAEKPDDPEGYYNLGTLSLRRNDLQMARKFLEQTLKLRQDYPEAWNNLGMIAAQEGNPEEAVRSFRRSLQLRPTYAIALLNLGNVYRRQGDWVKSLESLQHAATLQPDDPEISYSLGMFYAQQNRLDQASVYLQKAVTLRPDYPEARNNLGVLYVRSKAFAKAEQEFKQCIEIAPDFDQSYLNLARLYALQNDKLKARGVLQELQRRQPENEGASKALEVLDSLP